MPCLLSDVPFSVFAIIETFLNNEEEVAAAACLLKLGSYIIPRAWARGDYGWIGQAAREDCVLLGYTPGTRHLKKTMEDILNRHRTLAYVLLLCEHAIVVWVFRKYKVKEHSAGCVVVVVVVRLQTCNFPCSEKACWHLVFCFRHPHMFRNFLEILQR